MKFSYSRVDLFKRCPYHYKLKYIDQLTEIPSLDANNPLFVGHALHLGIEKGKQAMIDNYLSNYPVITDKIVNEMIKLELALEKVKLVLEGINIKFQEYELENDFFKGIVDLITENEDGTVDIFDFKYSNHTDNYMNSAQLHIYKHFLEEEGFKVNKMGYIFIPKTNIRQKKTEDLYQFRERIKSTYDELEIQLVEIPQDDMAMIYFMNDIQKIYKALSDPNYKFEENPEGECFACRFGIEYLEQIGGNIMALPTNKRREKKLDLSPDFWIYADSYVGKSTFVDSFDDVLFLNTDGNIDNTTSPVVEIKNIVTMNGRIKNVKTAWEVFLETLDDLETEKNNFKIVAIDLVEDLLEHCRSYVFEKNGWEHESDGGYGKGWDKVKKEFTDNMKRLKMLNYQIVFISKENRKEVKLKNGQSYTTFTPNLKEGQANILSGVVDLTIHAEKKGDERILKLITDEHTFGGGRYDFKHAECPLEKDAFLEEIKLSQQDRVEQATPTEDTSSVEKETPTADETTEVEEKPKKRRRRTAE